MLFSKLFLSIFLIDCLNIKTFVSSEQCLGVEGACDLKLEEVTLIGAHNAGAGFDGKLYYHNPYFVALSCAYRHQSMSVYNMLEAGIRYFNVALCYEDRKGYIKGAWGCQKDAYGGPMSSFLDQIHTWMNKAKNRKEIVVLYFNKHYEKGERIELLGEDISNQLKARWDPYMNRGKLSMQLDINEKLGDAINQNQRIYVFLHSNLRRQPRERFFFLEDIVANTKVSMAYIVSGNCRHLANKVADNCHHTGSRPFVSLDLYLSRGLCIDDLSHLCNKYIRQAANSCHRNIKADLKKNAHKRLKGLRSHTVNFIVLDYVTDANAKLGFKLAKEFISQYLLEKHERY